MKMFLVKVTYAASVTFQIVKYESSSTKGTF